ncbi:hypothetical protein [Hydrocoleum sp. CS-953]|nr:hypothetical protein [Hydrocoleum sp. CS-953]
MAISDSRLESASVCSASALALDSAISAKRRPKKNLPIHITVLLVIDN